MAEVTVIQYVLSRLKELGVTDVFGIPGDFAYPVCDAICDDAELRWIGCANEVNASYAADGYARRKGVGALVSTNSEAYGLGKDNDQQLDFTASFGMPLAISESMVGTLSRLMSRRVMFWEHEGLRFRLMAPLSVFPISVICGLYPLPEGRPLD